MDELGIVYLIENAQQFWSELEDIVHIQSSPTLSRLDATLKRFISFAASYHETYLQSPLQLEHACELIVDSELFTFHSERMCEILTDDASSSTDPHIQFILFNVLLSYGRRNSNFLRNYKRWQPLIPILMDHILIDIDPDIEDTYFGATGPSVGWNSASGSGRALTVPIEVKMRSLAVRLLYEVCRASKLNKQELGVFTDDFIDRLFDIVEQTRDMQDETFNYSVIKLIVALNEQFMVASLQPENRSNSPNPHGHKPHHHKPANGGHADASDDNRVLRVLIRRLGLSQTFGGNMIFMLNRADQTPEDRVMQLLVLKILYLLFSTPGTSEYFYTNDLCVLVDVFLRELVDLDEDQESLRHTYLRVLHPLLTKTQLRTTPYKRPQIVRTLESLIEHPEIREVSPTTRRLVERCLSGDWCVQLRKTAPKPASAALLSPALDGGIERTTSPSTEQVAKGMYSPDLTTTGSAGSYASSSNRSSDRDKLGGGTLHRQRSLKGSKSVENIRTLNASSPPKSRGLESLKNKAGPSNESASSLPGVAGAATSSSKSGRERFGSVASESGKTHHHHHSNSKKDGYPNNIIVSPMRSNSLGDVIDSITSPSYDHEHAHQHLRIPESVSSPISPPLSPTSITSRSSVASDATTKSTTTQKPARRSAPAPPQKRRKPPAVPVAANGGVTMVTIKSSKDKERDH